jgi:hypothetical protein
MQAIGRVHWLMFHPWFSVADRNSNHETSLRNIS